MNTFQQQLDDFRRTPDGKIIQGASHTCRVLNHKVRNKAIIKAVCDLRKISDQFDSIACCGISGLMVVPQIAELLDKHIVVIRKKNDKCYSEFPMEGVVPFRYIIVDDLVCSGSTIKYIKNTIYEDCPKAYCVGVYCYMPEECAYTSDTIKLFERDFRTTLLNPAPVRT
jgi:adenine/guanine phosphoribosyltransferase-like PRPP-binding protein